MATELTPVITYMTLDLATTNNFDFVKAVQGDHETRYIYITLLNDSVPYELNCESIILRGTKPDGTGVFNYCNLSENREVIVELTGQILAVPGIGKYEIALYGQAEVNEEADALTTFPFRIVVDKANIDAEVITSTNEFKAITEIMGNAETLKKSMDTIQEAKTSALQSKKDAALSAEDAAGSASTASAKAVQAGNSASAAAESEENAASSAAVAAQKANEASASAANAASSAATAENKANDASQSADTAVQKATEASVYAMEAESYAKGGTGTRENEDIDNAKYYYEQSRSISESFTGALRPMGTVTFANLPALASAVEGDMYNVSDQFTTTSSFKEGSGNVIPAGANIYKTADGYWDVLAGSPVTGVKGNAENTYHRGNVNLTPANLGITVVNNTADADKSVNYATSAGSAATADNANKLGGMLPSAGNVKSTIVARDENGYTYLNYIYSDTGNNENPPVSQVIVTDGGNFFRKASLGHLKSQMGLNAVNNTADGDKTVKSAGTCTGNSATATKLKTARTISLAGSVTGSGTFDGSGNLSITTSTNHTHSYLPLSGGKIDGAIGATGYIYTNNTAHFYANTGTTLGVGGQFYAIGNNTYLVANNSSSIGYLKLLAPIEVQCQGLNENNWIPVLASAFNTRNNSSRKLKDNIKDITDERAKQILAVKVVTFDYKEGVFSEEHRYDRTGVIAEDTEGICPEVINYDNNNPSGVQYDRFIPYLIKMVQIQQEEIEQLKSRLENLQTN